MNRRATRLTLVLAFLGGLLPLASVALFALIEADRLARAAQANAEAQRWEAAFQGYRAALSLNPWGLELSHALEETSRRWSQVYDGTAEPAAERALITVLADSGDDSSLSAVLDRSMAPVPAGAFWMGDAEGRRDEQPVRRITLRGFQIDRYEVTHAQYRIFIESTGADPPRYWVEDRYPQGTAAHPVVGVSWRQAWTFCRWAGKRLPTEAEWEKACRGEAGLAYPWGWEWDPHRANVGVEFGRVWPTRLEETWAWLAGGGRPAAPSLLPVGSLPEGSSPFGVMDLAGNASEWVEDAYNWTGYEGLPSEEPLITEPPWNHVVRGSGWIDLPGQQPRVAFVSRCAARSSSHSAGDPRVGFRCAQNLPGEAPAD